MTTSEHRRGVLFMLGATSCWAMAGILVRTMRLTEGWEITFWRSLFMTAFVLALLRWQYRAGCSRASALSGGPERLSVHCGR